jgi:hypothetical protein
MGTALVIAVLWARHQPAAPPGITLEPVRLLADGYDSATLTFHSDRRPRITIDPPYAATVEDITDSTARIRAGVLPAQIRVRVEFPNSTPATFQLATSLTAADTFEDGTPDFLRLDDDRDRMAFRRWFTFLAETQYFQAPGARPAEIDDCAALIRYAYRETFRAHDVGWAEAARVPVVPVFVLPMFSGIAARGWRGAAEFGRHRRSRFDWFAAPVLLLCALALPWQLVGWVPRVSSFAVEMLSFIARAKVAYLLFITGWICLASLTSGGKRSLHHSGADDRMRA